MLKRALAAIAATLTLITAGLVAASPAQAAATRYYAGGGQSFSGTLPNAMFATMRPYNPTLDCTGPNWESTNILEIALSQGTGGTFQAAEVGAIKKCNAGVPEADMSVMVYVWRNGVACGYTLVNLCGTTHDFQPCDTVGGVNNCGQATDNWDVGQTIPSGTVVRQGVQYFNGDWWFVTYTNGGTFEYLGWIEDDLWTDVGVTFNTGTLIQGFSETGPGGGSLGCTDVGTGALPATPNTGALIGSVALLPNVFTVDIDSISYITDATKYNAIATAPGPNVRTLLIGGPGSC